MDDGSAVEPTELLAQHGVPPAQLEPAPAPPALSEVITRILAARPHPCSACGADSATARVVPFPGMGLRWVDLCWEHGMSVRRRSRVPTTLEGIAADLRAAAGEAGLPQAARLTFTRSGNDYRTDHG
ncbi:hypothetical protein [Streptomyces ardesiacus]|uniref:hypothetical protein n=1 Tax=Streptomyces ardesiacus TaxID=285564 RepID=UPI003F4A45A8